MRVLIVGSGGVALTRPLDWVVKSGHEVWLLGDDDPYENHPPDNYRFFPTVLQKYREEITDIYAHEPRMAEENAEPLRKLVDEFQPDVIHVHAIGWHAQFCALANVRPLVVSAWGFLNHLIKSKEVLEVEKDYRDDHTDRVAQVFEKTDVLIVETPILVENSKPLLNQDRRVELMPLGTNTQHFCPGVTRDLQKWRWELFRAKEDTTVLLSPRGLAELYNHEQIYDAYALAYSRFTRPTIIVFSSMGRSFLAEEASSVYDKICKKAGELGILENIRWLPGFPYDLMPTLYNVSDVIVNYPKQDAFPSTVVEAIACERPVITCDLLAYQGTFITEFCTLVEPENTSALAEAMIKIVNQPSQERKEHLARARQVVVERCDETILQRQLLQIYEDLISRRKESDR
ncbi:glycosyltransferase family 4 protein [Pannus brasiliensis CCIBt3594]|uniref:Glycosyltransferase family 4 protein n=1 Tax=Pannus brasiliensis CCIBt3594 TaxID=1427578 RepID=A0AAW9QZD0_9CHRO